MLTVANSGALVSGAPRSSEGVMTQAIVTRGVLVRGKGKAEGTILDVVPHPSQDGQISHEELAILKSSNFVEEVKKKTAAKDQPAGTTEAAIPEDYAVMKDEADATTRDDKRTGKK